MWNKLKNFGPLFIITTALLWAFDGVLRISLYSLPPTVVVFYEHALGALVLLPFAKLWFPDVRKMTKKEWIAITAVALFSGAIGTIFYTAALQKVQFIPYSVVVLLQQQLQPIWAIGAAALLLKEKISRKFLLWAGVALIAIYFVTFKDMRVNFGTGNETLIAGLLALGAGFMWGSTTAVSKVVLNKVSFLTGSALRFYLAPIFAFLILVGQGQAHALFTLHATQWITLWAITFSTGLVAIIIYYYGLRRTPARVSAICEMAFPGSAVFIDYFYYHNSLSITQILGAIVLVFAIYQVTKFTTAAPVKKASKDKGMVEAREFIIHNS